MQIHYLIKLNNVGMPNNLKNMNLPCDSLNIWLIFDLIFLQNFDSNFLSSEYMRTESHLAKGTLPKGPTFTKSFIEMILTHHVVANLAIICWSLLVIHGVFSSDRCCRSFALIHSLSLNWNVIYSTRCWIIMLLGPWCDSSCGWASIGRRGRPSSIGSWTLYVLSRLIVDTVIILNVIVDH